MKSLVALVLAAGLLLGGLSAPADAQVNVQTAVGILGASATATTCTSAACVTLPNLAGQSTCWVDVAPGATGNFNATGVIEIAGANGLWYSVPATSWSGGAATSVTTVTAAGLYSAPAGPVGCRFRLSAYTSGLPFVNLYASDQTAPAGSSGSGGGGGNGTTVVTNSAASPVPIYAPSPLAVSTAPACTSATCSTTVTGTVTVGNPTQFPYNPQPQATTPASALGVNCVYAPGTTATAGQSTAIACDANGNPILGQGTNTIGNVNQTTTTPGYTRVQDGSSTRLQVVTTAGAGMSTGNNTGYVTGYNAALKASGASWDPFIKDSEVLGPVNFTMGGLAYTRLTSASATSCTSLETGTGRFVGVTNTSTTAQTVTISFYDEGASPTCAAADILYQVTLGASQVVSMPNGGPYLTSGLAYTLSAALTNSILVQRY